MDVTVKVNVEHFCKRYGRRVYPGEIITINRSEASKRLRLTYEGNPLISIKGERGPTSSTVGPTENQADPGPPENKESLSKSKLHQMRKADLLELGEDLGVSEDMTKDQIITTILEEK